MSTGAGVGADGVRSDAAESPRAKAIRERPGAAGGRRGGEQQLDERAARSMMRLGAAVARRLQINPRWSGEIERDDVLQQTYVDACIAVRSGSVTVRDLPRWLPRAAQNNLRDAIESRCASKRPPSERRIRPQSRADPLGHLEPHTAPDDADPSTSIADSELLAAIETEIDRLPALEFSVLDLVIVRGLSCSDAADRVGRDRTTVARILRRTLTRIRRSVAPH